MRAPLICEKLENRILKSLDDDGPADVVKLVNSYLRLLAHIKRGSGEMSEEDILLHGDPSCYPDQGE